MPSQGPYGTQTRNEGPQSSFTGGGTGNTHRRFEEGWDNCPHRPVGQRINQFGRVDRETTDQNYAAMSRDFFDPTPELQNVVLVDTATVLEIERLIDSCEHCNPTGAETPFDYILDCVIGCDPTLTHYILEQPAKCPRCRNDILEKTLIES